MDRSVRYLSDMGYNVVRHPSAGLEPLHVFGELRGEFANVGKLDDLVEDATETLPVPVKNVEAADINGKQTSKLPLSIGIDLLSAVMTGLGGNVKVAAEFEAARTLQFQFTNVSKSLVNLADIGRYLDSGTIRWDATGIREFFEPGGTLYLVTTTVASPSFGVTAHKSRSAKLEVDVPVIEGLLGDGNVSAGVDTSGESQMTFAGQVSLVFGFTCVELAVTEHPKHQDELRLTIRPVRSGEVALSLGEDQAKDAKPVLFSDSGLITEIPGAT
ncbi:MAG: hypothetical protein AAFQ58_01270 [Pseudomonadota bacterium]